MNTEVLYLIPFLHQTTTRDNFTIKGVCCILFHFYIKPQLERGGRLLYTVVSYSISTSNHNVSRGYLDKFQVVSYSISTSNHNTALLITPLAALYLIPFLHQTTTGILTSSKVDQLYLIPFLHQTTTSLIIKINKMKLYLIPFLHQTTTQACYT